MAPTNQEEEEAEEGEGKRTNKIKMLDEASADNSRCGGGGGAAATSSIGPDSRTATPPPLPLPLDKLDTEVSLDGGPNFNRTKTRTNLIWLPHPAKRLFQTKSGICANSTLISETKTKTKTTTSTTREATKKRIGQMPETTSSNPMISIEVSEPTTKQEHEQRQRQKQHEKVEEEENSDEENDDEDSLVCSVENVRHNFISLINFNKFLYFYLAALIYSVINLGFILYYLSEQSADSQHQQQQQQLEEDELFARRCRSVVGERQQAAIEENLYKLVRWFIGPAISILVAVVIVNIVEFNSNSNSNSNPNTNTNKQQQNQKSKVGRIIYRFSQTIGQIDALLLLNLPFVLFLVHQLSSLSAGAETEATSLVNCVHDDNNDNDHDGDLAGESRLPLGALLAVLYLQPFFIEALNAKVTCLLQILSQALSIFLLCWLTSDKRSSTTTIYGQPDKVNGHHDSERHLAGKVETSSGLAQWILLICLSLVPILMFGVLRRYRFRRSICRDTFSGAGDLIEAKVSLEHQRQQQETLLLSVLPAYVAEQVKRNMLKKTNTSAGSNGGGGGHNEQLQASGQQQQSLGPADWAGAQPASTQTTINQAFQDQASGSIIITHSNSASVIQGTSVNTNTNSKLVVTSAAGPSSRLMKVESSTSLQKQHCHYQGGESKRSSSRSAQPTALSSCSNLGGGVCLPAGQVATPPPNQQHLGGVRRGFNELYIRTYNNVSLLYGDIVGFTRLCTQLSSSQLVRVLNDLFSHFDHLAERHKIMRIKILGDCYYGVSGIPEFAVMGAKSRALKNENHAINCVNMGLDMISYIKCLNVERSEHHRDAHERLISMSHSASGQVLAAANGGRKGSAVSISGSRSAENCTSSVSNHHTVGQHAAPDIQSPLPVFELNMRIGVHSGHIHSGVIGLKKWQFDVWSNDVSIAMRCESSGTAGRVQVTEATVQQLNGAFSYEEASGPERDTFLATKGIKTYLIKDRCSNVGSSSTFVASSTRLQSPTGGDDDDDHLLRCERAQRANKRQQQRQRLLKDSMEKAEKDLMLDEDKIRAATIGTIRQTLLAGESCDASGGCNSTSLALHHNDLRPLGLQFRDPIIGKLYKTRLARSLARETAAVLLLLLILLPLLDYQLLPAPTPNDVHHHHHQHHDRLMMFALLPATSAVCIFILLLGLVWARLRNRKNIRSGARNSLNNHHKPSGLRSTNTAVDWSRKGRFFVDDLEGDFEGDCGGGGGQVRKYSLSGLRSGWRRCYRSVCRSKYSPTRLVSAGNGGTRISKFRSFTVVLIFLIVIALQNYLIFRQKYCPSIQLDNSGGNLEHQQQDVSARIKRLVSIEPHQLAVIFLLVCLDSSVDSIGYRSKLFLLIIVICMNVFFTFTTNPMPDQLVRFFNQHNLTTSTCYRDDSHQDKYLQQQYRSWQPHDQIGLDRVQALIDWSTSALLTLVALLSVVYARQLEYTSRANFLWRNRLNVDHEELEYISGINKVLLENILPSHVVEHYMSHPNEQPQHQHQKQKQHNRRSSQKLPNLQNYMRMSEYPYPTLPYPTLPHLTPMTFRLPLFSYDD